MVRVFQLQVYSMCDLLQSIEPAWITLVDGQKKRKNQMKSNANVNVNKMLI